MTDDRNDAAPVPAPPPRSRTRTFFGALGTGALLNLALIAWCIYQQNWWLTAVAVAIGIVMLAMALTAARRSEPTPRA